MSKVYVKQMHFMFRLEFYSQSILVCISKYSQIWNKYLKSQTHLVLSILGKWYPICNSNSVELPKWFRVTNFPCFPNINLSDIYNTYILLASTTEKKMQLKVKSRISQTQNILECLPCVPGTVQVLGKQCQHPDMIADFPVGKTGHLHGQQTSYVIFRSMLRKKIKYGHVMEGEGDLETGGRCL